MKHSLRITAVLSAAAMMLSLSAIFPAHAASVCQIDTSSTHQTIRGFGGINLPEWISQGDMTDAQRQKAFGNGEDELGLTILRIYCSDDSNAWKNAVPTAKYAQKMGATIFATPWNPPASMRINGDGTITGGKYQLDKSKSAQYAQHLNSFVKYIESQGINLYSISVQNEPDYAAEWTYWSADELTSFIANYGKAVTAGTKAKLMSPESFQYRKEIYNAILANPQASANVDLYGTHFYGTPREWMDFPALENSGKEIWMTEVYVPDSHADSADLWPDALDVSRNIHNGVVVGNLNAYVWWYIRRSYGLMKENGQISKRGYCMAQYSKFVRPGDVRIDATESPEKEVYVSAYKNNKGQVTVVAVNNSDNGYAQQFNLAKGENITDVDRWRTSASESIALTENLEYTGSSFWAQLPAKSVSTFVITTDGTSSSGEEQQPTEVQPDENGYYFQDTFEGSVSDWTARGAATVKLSGRTAYQGKEALLAMDRTSAWHGSAKPLDENTFKPGNAYSFSTNAMYFDG
ncbi:MAG: carbohydrate binding domain-containing protein, partial [Oscillospiraceae bacterium]|nr:carbohydrate binding domain-containing protein [Oscillospiraceae bacterium]